MKNKLKSIIILIFISFQLSGQKLDENAKMLEFVKTIQSCYSIDDLIVNGYQYIFPSDKIVGTPFYNQRKWNDTKIFIDNRTFSDYKLKYDLVNNLIIIKLISKEKTKFVELNKFKIDSFILNSSIFVNSINLTPNDEGVKCLFYEKIFKGNVSLYKNYSKRFINLYDEMSPNGKFSATKIKLYIVKENLLYFIKNDRSFINFFEKKYHKNIKEYLNTYNIKLKTASSKELIKVMEYCNKLISI